MPAFAAAQLSEPIRPQSQLINLPATVKTVEMPAIDLPAIQLVDKREDKFNQPKRFAFPFPVDLGFKDGTWTQLPGGDRVWRLKITAPGAQGMTLLYDRFFLPPGATLHLRNPVTNETMGAYTAKNNNDVKRFATGILLGDVTVLEYYEPAAQRGRGALNVAQVGHAYRMMSQLKGLNDSGPCQVNINCDEGADWQDEKRGVAHYTINGTATCSGTLVNNTSGDATPYFLTADHCIGGLDALGNVDASGYVFFWDYERSGCDNSGPVPINTTSGATLVANNTDSDFALFRLTESPNLAFTPYFNGWSRDADPGLGGVGIHHPALDAKKIATHTIVPASTSSPTSGISGTAWRVNWIATPNGHSVTEGGSSGSGLWNNDGLLIGQLFGGSSVNCSDPANDPGIYGQIAYSWDSNGASSPGRRLRDWLDPANTGATVLTGAYLDQPPPSVGFANANLLNNGTYRESPGAGDVLPDDCRPYVDYPVVVTASYTLSEPFDVFIASGGTAEFGKDYVLFPEDFTLTPAASTATATLRIFDDSAIESPEQLSLTITGSGGEATVGTNNQLNFTLDDNDFPLAPTSLVDILVADFNGGIPTGWLVENNGSTTETWKSVATYQGGNSIDGSSFVIVDSDAAGNGSSTNESLLSPRINLAGVSSIELSFDQYFRVYTQGGFETATVEVYDGSSWVSVYNLDQNDGNVGSWNAPDTPTLDLTAYGNSRFQVRFRYTGAFDWWWALDNVRISIVQPTQLYEVVTSTPVDVYLDAFTTVNVIDPTTGHVVAELENPTAEDYGCTSVFLDRVVDSGKAFPLYSDDIDQLVFARALRVETGNNPVGGSYRLRYFVGNGDVDGWQSFTGSSVSAVGMIRVADAAIPDVTPADFAGRESEWLPVSTGTLGDLLYLEAEMPTGTQGIAVGLDPASLLPVRWRAFTGRSLSPKANELYWSTANEQNNDRFEVELSTAGGDFRYLGTVAASGEAEAESNYRFMHEDPATGDNYYRLRQVDHSGAFSFSEVVKITTVRAPGLGRVLVSPVRASTLRLQVGSRTTSVDVYDANGRCILRRELPAGHAPTLELPMSGLAAGVYLVRFAGGGELATDRVVVR